MHSIDNLKKLAKNAPEATNEFRACDKAALADGAVPKKYKELVKTQCMICGADWGTLFFFERCPNCRMAQLAFDDLIERAAVAPLSGPGRRPRIIEPRGLKVLAFGGFVRPQYLVVLIFSGFVAGFFAAWLVWRH